MRLLASWAATVKPGSTAVVVGDGAVGWCGVIAAKEMGAERIVAMSRHDSRRRLALAFGATDIVTERGEEGLVRSREMTGGIGADAVLECLRGGPAPVHAYLPDLIDRVLTGRVDPGRVFDLTGTSARSPRSGPRPAP